MDIKEVSLVHGLTQGLQSGSVLTRGNTLTGCFYSVTSLSLKIT